MFIQPLAFVAAVAGQPAQAPAYPAFAPPQQAVEQDAASVPPAEQPAQPVKIIPYTGDLDNPEPDPDGFPSEDNGIVVIGRTAPPPGDPLIQLNEDSYRLTQDVDDAVVGPVAHAYRDEIPHPIRTGLINFLHNLGEPVIFLNFLLQLKPGKAFETLGRFAINTTIGIGGILDVAKEEPFNLPRRENGFANTLGYYGVEPGPFLFVPLAGPTTLRDLVGDVIDITMGPAIFGKPFNRPAFAVPAAVLNRLDHRLEVDEEMARIEAEEDDPYTARKESYLELREAEIEEIRAMPAFGRQNPKVPEPTLPVIEVPEPQLQEPQPQP